MGIQSEDGFKAQETLTQFESRKQEHIKYSLSEDSQTANLKDLSKIVLIHEGLPDINFKEVDLSTSFFSSQHQMNIALQAPFFISSMTAGHSEGELINHRLAQLSASKQILMGIGSQRKDLEHSDGFSEWKKIKKSHPKSLLVSNLGITQVLQAKVETIQKIIDATESVGLFIHTNPLQEVLQKEGTPQFKNSLIKLEEIVKKIKVPVIVKEVGSGFSERTLERLESVGVFAVDVAALGGTHWGRVEGLRNKENEVLSSSSQVFSNWGMTLVESLESCQKTLINTKFWASGGIRSGLEVAQCLAMGAQLVGAARPFLQNAIQSEEALEQMFNQWEYQLKIALFCTGSQSISDIKGRYFKRGHL